jgi:hypothetical protein
VYFNHAKAYLKGIAMDVVVCMMFFCVPCA